MKLGLKSTAKGYGRLVVSGSTRYSSSGHRGSKLKTFGATQGGVVAGSYAGGAIGRVATMGAHNPTTKLVGGLAGSVAGAHVGAVAGRHYAAKQGWTGRNKSRMSVRAYHAVFHNTHGDIGVSQHRTFPR